MAFNKLTDAETERLDILAEECAEVIQAISKIKRHGYESDRPHYHTASPSETNRAALEREIGHVVSSVARMYRLGDLSQVNVMDSAGIKDVEVLQYLHHN